MIRLSELKLPLAEVPTEHRRAADAPTETRADREPPPQPTDALRALAAQALGIDPGAIASLQVFKRSFDARKAALLAVYIVDVTLADPAQTAPLLARFAQHPHIQPTPDMTWHAPGHAPANWPDGHEAQRPVVIGLGPCGLFAALALAQMGLKPIVLERGKPVRQRTKDTWGLWRHQKLNPQSNVQYGEGGAGLFSDGKLYSQIKDPRFLGRKVMQEFVDAGAPKEILYTAHPHIGT
ncbi:MAG TPA: FAD-dependent oxidoreductase, partial [Hydrogenophaga sp.]